MMDWIPGVSQVKSLVQVIAGDPEGARRTQENFSRQCPVVSQMRSAVEAIAGDENAARETQEEFGRAMSDAADSIPVVGHVKGGIHYAAGDKDGGDKAVRSATAGTLGYAFGGPVGAVLGADLMKTAESGGKS